MKVQSVVLLLCSLLLGLALVAASDASLELAEADVAEDLELDVSADAEEDEEAADDEAEAEGEDEAESEDEVFLQEAAAASAAAAAAVSADAKKAAAHDTSSTLSNAFDALVAHEIAASDAAAAHENAEAAALDAATEAAVESTLRAAHVSIPAEALAAHEAEEAEDESEEQSLVESDAVAESETDAESETEAEASLDLGIDLGASLEAAASDETALDAWLDAAFAAEAAGPLDAEEPLDRLIADAPALPRNLVKIVPPAPEKKHHHHKHHGKHHKRGAAAKKLHHKRHHTIDGKPVHKHDGKAEVPFIDPRVVRKWKNIKETTQAYLKAVRKHIAKKYGKSSAAVAASGVKVTKEVYHICHKYGRNKFLCAVLRDLWLKKFVRADVDLFTRKQGRRFVRENMKKIIKFTHHHIAHPDEFVGEFINQKYLKNPYTVCPKRMGREIRKFLRALRYAVAEHHPDLTHEVADNFNSVYEVTKKKCHKLHDAVEFAHPICRPLLRVMKNHFAGKDVFLNRKVRAAYVRAVKKRVKKARRVDRKAKGLPIPDPQCGGVQRKKKHHRRHHRKPAPTSTSTPAAPAAPANQNVPDTPNVASTTNAAAAAGSAGAGAGAGAGDATPRKHHGHRKGGNGKGKGKRSSSSSSSGASNLLYSRVNAKVTKDQYEITVRLSLNYNKIAANPDDLDLFIKGFTADVAKALGCDASRIKVTAVQSATDASAGGSVTTDSTGKAVMSGGSSTSASSALGVNVKFVILPHPSAPNGASNPKDPNSVDALADKFATQSQDKSSVLMASPIVSKTDATSTISLTKQQTTTTAAASSTSGKSAAPAAATFSAVVLGAASLIAWAAARL